MDIFVNGLLNTQVFETEVRRDTHELTDVLFFAVKTQSAQVEPIHFLMAMARIPGGQTQRDIQKFGITPEQWETGLSSCITCRSVGAPPERLAWECLHPDTLAMLEEARKQCEESKEPRISEVLLLLSALHHLSAPARDVFEGADINLEEWCARLTKALVVIEPVKLFDPDLTANLEHFSPSGRKVLDLMRSEAEAMGYEMADPRHLLLALVLREGGAAQYGLHRQGVTPRKLQEALSLSLRARARRTRSVLPLDREHLQLIVCQILQTAADLAAREQVERIADVHILRAFLQTESMARRVLEDEGVRLTTFKDVADAYEIGDEPEETDTIADVETVRARLLKRLVGQDDAVERILPYVQRMRFGFSVTGKPVGVFLFCGQSGSGKTEMAKELARGVYGSEENLIFLEMGQFNSPESMNIFVGAPPGYIGYGEGKLTNGLRDKPRSVVLFDEVEKAHARVLDALLRFLDEGKIDDPAGPVRDGSECILILTSNVGAKELSLLWDEVENNPNWRAEIRKRLREEFEKHNFRIEFLNRVDELILFRTLSAKDYTEIANRQLGRLLERLQKEKQIEATYDPHVAAAIGRYCSSVNEGARPVLRLVNSLVISRVIDFVLMNHMPLPAKARVILAGLGSDDENVADGAEPRTLVIPG